MRVHQFGKLRKDLHHLVGTLSAGGNDHDIGLGLLGDGVLKHRLARTERPRNKSRAPLYNRIHRINGTYARLQQFERTRLFLIIGHGHFHRPFLHHGYGNVLTVLSRQHGYRVFAQVVTFRNDAFHRSHPLHGYRCHDFQGLVVFLHLAQPSGSPNLVSGFRDGLKMPFFVFIQRISVLSATQEYSLHLVQVVLQTVVVLGKHTRPQRHLEHVPGKFSLSPDFHTPGTFKHLHVCVPTDHLNHFGHQTVSACRDVADLILRHRAVHLNGHDIGDDSNHCTSCCHIIIFFFYFLNSWGISTSFFNCSTRLRKTFPPRSLSICVHRSMMSSLMRKANRRSTEK